MNKAEKRERRAHFRGAARRGQAVELEYRTDRAEPVASTTRNIGIGGAFIETPSPPAVGTRLRVTIRVSNDGRPMELNAAVRWTDDGAAPGSQAGMGIEFCDLEPDAVVRLSDFVASLVGSDTEL